MKAATPSASWTVTSTPSSRPTFFAARIHLFDDVGVLLVEDTALELQCRRDLTVVDREFLRKDFKPLDLLVAREGLVHFRDQFADPVVNLLIPAQILKLGRFESQAFAQGLQFGQ